MATLHSDSSMISESIPAWAIAELFPHQGQLTEADYLSLTEHTRRLAEFNHGQIEVLPMPTIEHQRIVLYLITLLSGFVRPRKLGEALMAPVRARLDEGKFREPDLLFMLNPKALAQSNRYWIGADLVMEVVSDDDPNRDYQDKRRDYAQAGIGEYWIVDPRTKTISVLRLENGQYVGHDEASKMGQVKSALLNGFAIDVAAAFSAGQGL